MKKTPAAARFTHQLIKVNDQLCFSALRQWEFEQALAPLIVTRPADFTPAIFSANPFAGNIYRKIRDLPAFSREAEQVALRMGVIAGVEHSLAYLEEVQSLRQSLIKSVEDGIKDDAEEEQLRRKIERWSGKSPDAGHFLTLGYLRFLRNHYAHVNDKPSAAFGRYISSYGTPLNKFWNNHATDLHGIDFRTLASVTLTPDLTFGIMNVMRVCLQHVDCLVADTLSVTAVVQYLLDEIFQSPRDSRLGIERIASKVKHRLRMAWNIHLSLPVVAEEVERCIANRL